MLPLEEGIPTSSNCIPRGGDPVSRAGVGTVHKPDSSTSIHNWSGYTFTNFRPTWLEGLGFLNTYPFIRLINSTDMVPRTR